LVTDGKRQTPAPQVGQFRDLTLVLSLSIVI
jgi:hypothetical protein